MREVSPSSEWCQRWSSGRMSWRHAGERFDPTRYHVELIDDDSTAKSYVVEHHYAASYPAALMRFGLFEADQLVGVCVLSNPVRPEVLTGPFPQLVPAVESMELGRLVLADRVPANGESWFVARCFRRAAQRGVLGVVSFSDPVPRHVAGQLVFPGHVGWIYQALSGVYAGRGRARWLTVLPDGSTWNDRTAQKVKQQHRGHEYAERKLLQLGAPARLDDEEPADWMARALRSVGAARIRHGGNHRYCFSIGRDRRSRLALAHAPYPKGTDR